VDGVAETAVERGEEASCARADSLIGGGPPRWAFRAGGASLGDRLCLAQGLSPWADDALLTRQSELVRATGARTLRIDFRWALIEPERGRFDFARDDRVMDAADAAGVEVLALLLFGVPWATEATDDDEHYPPDDPADFARFAAEVARRYAGRIDRYEIWNEPNGGYRFWLPTLHGDAAAFAELQALAARAISGECAGCTIVSAGLFFHEQLINGALEFTHDMLRARPDALVDIDAFGLHPYPRYPPRDDPEADGADLRSFGAMDADLRELLLRHDVVLPIAATELGWPVYGSVDEARQAALLSRAMLLGAALDWDPLCWFNVTDGPMHGRFPPEDDFGLYRFGSEDPAAAIDPKPARDAFAWLASLGRARFTGVRDDAALHDPDAGRFALDFEGPDGRWTALFARAAHEVAIETSHTVHDHLGAIAGASPGVLEIGTAPIFLLPP
jgi:hypothetical protein